MNLFNKYLEPEKELDSADERFHKAVLVGVMAGLPIHLLVFFYYLFLEIEIMALINFFGLLAYIVSFFLIRKSNYKTIYLICSIEILVVTFFDLLYTGWNSGFHYYILLLLPVYFLYSKWTRIENIIALISIPACYLITYLYGLRFQPFYPLSEEEAYYSDGANFLIAALVFLIIVVYYNKSIVFMENRLLSKNKELKKGNDDKKVLLKEIHHRVKNNLHVVNSILEVQALEVKDKKLKSYLQDAQRRIISMATIHEKMYGSDNLKYISASEYIESLIFDLQKIYDSECKIKIELEFQDVDFDLDTIAPLAFLVNEVVTNSYKHAFTDSEHPKIFGSLKIIDDKVSLKLGDNGSGFIEKLEKSNSSLGVDLIDSFVNELGASYQRIISNGTIYSFVFDRKLVMPEIKER